MSNGPSDEDVKRAERAAQDARDTAKAMAPYVEANRLNPSLLKKVLDRFAMHGDDAAEDGIYDQRWMSSDTFYNNTVDYVPFESRAEYKGALDAAFPKRKP